MTKTPNTIYAGTNGGSSARFLSYTKTGRVRFSYLHSSHVHCWSEKEFDKFYPVAD